MVRQDLPEGVSENDQHQKQIGNLSAMTSVTYNDTRALNARKALCAALISMSRGEIPVRLLARSRLFFAYLSYHIITTKIIA